MDDELSQWEELRGERVFLTGGTGFIGRSLLEALTAHGALVTILSRNPAPNLGIEVHRGDVRTFPFPQGEFPFVIHAAADVSNLHRPDAALDLFDTIVNGTRRVLDFASCHGAKKLLFVSSGAVYGLQPADLTHIPDDFTGAPDPTDPHSAYGEAKRAAEMLCALYGQRHGMEIKIARCFAFAGAGLPLDGAFALGNFIRDAMAGGPIRVRGDGTARRSYLDVADLAHWLSTILLAGKAGRTYNVGSEHDISLADLAHTVARTLHPEAVVTIAQAPVPGSSPARYVPSTARARTELGLRENISLPDAILRTAKRTAGKP